MDYGVVGDVTSSIQEGGKTGRNLNFAMNNIDTAMTVPAGETNFKVKRKKNRGKTKEHCLVQIFISIPLSFAA